MNLIESEVRDNNSTSEIDSIVDFYKVANKYGEMMVNLHKLIKWHKNNNVITNSKKDTRIIKGDLSAKTEEKLS